MILCPNCPKALCIILYFFLARTWVYTNNGEIYLLMAENADWLNRWDSWTMYCSTTAGSSWKIEFRVLTSEVDFAMTFIRQNLFLCFWQFTLIECFIMFKHSMISDVTSYLCIMSMFLNWCAVTWVLSMPQHSELKCTSIHLTIINKLQ